MEYLRSDEFHSPHLCGRPVITYLVLGVTYAFAAAVQPGPLQACLASLALSQGWRRALPAALSPVVSDGPIIVLVLLVLSRIPAWAREALGFAGGFFLLYLAVMAFRAWRESGGSRSRDPVSARRGLLMAVVVNWLNPGPYLGWALVMGPLLLKGWREAPANGLALLVSFYATMVLTLAGFIIAFAAFGRIGPRVSRWLIGASAVALAGFGVYQIVTCVRGFIAG